MAGKLEYRDYDNLLTTVEWFKPSIADRIVSDYTKRVQGDHGTIEAASCVVDAVNALEDSTYEEYCGTENPLSIKWAGDRYKTSAPSSATIRLMIETAEDRAALEDIFNGGYQVTVNKETTHGSLLSTKFWHGQITPMLSLEAYKSYPYVITLNANDGLAMAKQKQFLMIDFPEPWPSNKISILDYVNKLIGLYLYPSDLYNINVAMRMSPDSGEASDLTTTYIDPLVFMESDKDQYITNDKVIESLLGPLNLQIIQWNGEWWLLDLEAQWDKGNLTYTKYTVVNGVATLIGTQIYELGLLDLYACGDTDVGINQNARIDFISPWLNATINQEFQMNNCILPVYANRLGNFYRGHEIKGTADFIPLEFITDYHLNQKGNLRHWINEDLTINQWGDNSHDNTGYVWVNTVKSGQAQDPVSTTWTVNSAIEFNKFTFNVATMPTWKNEPNSLADEFTPKTNIEIKYTDTSNNHWWFWLNNGVGDFYGWIDEFSLLEFDVRNINVEAMMPDRSSFIGGTFTVKIYNSDNEGPPDPEPGDELGYGPDYGMLINNLRLGIVASVFNSMRVNQTDDNIRFRNILKMETGFLAFDPVTFLASTSALLVVESMNRRRDRNNQKVIGGTKEAEYESQDLNWNDTVRIDINSNADTTESFAYKWGLDLPSVQAYHEYHLSSPYTTTDVVVDKFTKAGETGSLSLVDWKSRQFYRDNSEYTTRLSGEFLSDNITPMQLVHDFEGRVYKFNNGTWNDKRGSWSCAFVEFKALKNIPARPVNCDFSKTDFNDDFCKEFTSGYVADYFNRVSVDGGITEALGCVQGVINYLS